MSSRKWLNCRLSDVQKRLGKHRVSTPVISRILKARNYRLRGNVKEICSKQDPERNAQFEHIQAQRQEHQKTGAPCLSTDTKKKELIGNFKNSGQIWCQSAEQVHVHDFTQDSLGRAVPYGVYDLQFNRGTVYNALGRKLRFPTFEKAQFVTAPGISWAFGRHACLCSGQHRHLVRHRKTGTFPCLTAFAD